MFPKQYLPWILVTTQVTQLPELKVLLQGSIMVTLGSAPRFSPINPTVDFEFPPGYRMRVYVILFVT